MRRYAKEAASAYRAYKKRNPLMIRKKLTAKDVVYRREEPDRELFRMEVAWDGELYVLLAVAVVAMAILCWKVAGLFRKVARRFR